MCGRMALTTQIYAEDNKMDYDFFSIQLQETDTFVTPEQKLWRSVALLSIAENVHDCLCVIDGNNIKPLTSRQLDIFSESVGEEPPKKEYFKSKDFIMVCDLAGFDYDFIYNAVEKHLK